LESAMPTANAEQAKLLLLEGVNDSAVELLQTSGFSAIERLPKALEGNALRKALKGISLLGIRSRTALTQDVFAAADQLVAVGCFSVGTNQVDLNAARRRGIPVFNAPFSNTRSVAELVIGEIVMLLRQIFPRSVSAHDGGWDKSAAGSREVRGRTLGIIGYGNIGSQLSTLAEAMGMRVIYFDRTDKLRHGAGRSAGDFAGAKRRRQSACSGDARNPQYDRCAGITPDEARLLPDQQQPRYRGRSGCACGSASRRTSGRCGA
jgi:D-3-phosphoglycerate dehydrogenase / 2-oxoglutarate reductase